MYRISFVLLLLGLLVSGELSSQGLQPHNVEGWRVGVVPSTIVASVPSYQAHLSYGMSPASNVGVSIGYVHLGDRERVDGVVVRPIYRYFFYPDDGFYLGLAGDFRFTQRDKRAFVDRFSGAYEEFFEFSESNTYLGGTLFIGQYMDYGNIGFDVGFGVGGLTRHTKYTGLPSEVSSIRVDDFGPFDTERRSVSGEWWSTLTLRLHFAIMFEL